ncbi:MAG: hypothetical protein ACKO2P_03705, partial [Planctomycetota bacterium]
MERPRGDVVGSAGTVPGGRAGRISAARPPWLCNRGYRCNTPNHHKPKNRPNRVAQISRSDLLSPQGLSPQRGAPVWSRGQYDRQNVSVRSLGGLSPAGQEPGHGAWHPNG